MRTAKGRDGLEAELTRAILANEIAPGESIPTERVLAERHGISRSAVREVLHGLIERGLLESRQGSGTFATDLASNARGTAGISSAVLRAGATPGDLIESRLVLEVPLAGLAAECGTPDQVSALERLDRELEGSNTAIERARCDMLIHSLIADSSNNPVLRAMFAAIEGFCFDMMVRSHADPIVPTRPAASHVAIIAAIRAGDPAAAREAMRAHLLIARGDYGDDLDRPLIEVAAPYVGSRRGGLRP